MDLPTTASQSSTQVNAFWALHWKPDADSFGRVAVQNSFELDEVGNS